MKQNLREEALWRRDKMPETERREKSERITAQILSSAAYQEAKRLFVFVSMGSEVEIRTIIEQAWRDGKQVAVPKTEKGGQMYFLPIISFSELRKGRFGVMEPLSGREKEIAPEESDLFLVPGALFDERKNRIGYGGGYYDRYFATHNKVRFCKVGLAFSTQLQEELLPTEQTDIPLDAIVTEDGWRV